MTARSIAHLPMIVLYIYNTSKLVDSVSCINTSEASCRRFMNVSFRQPRLAAILHASIGSDCPSLPSLHLGPVRRCNATQGERCRASILSSPPCENILSYCISFLDFTYFRKRKIGTPFVFCRDLHSRRFVDRNALSLLLCPEVLKQIGPALTRHLGTSRSRRLDTRYFDFS